MLPRLVARMIVIEVTGDGTLDALVTKVEYFGPYSMTIIHFNMREEGFEGHNRQKKITLEELEIVTLILLLYTVYMY